MRAVTGSTWAVGGTGECTTGTWRYATSYAYQWQRNALPIAGATSSRYVLTSADAGTTLSCRVVATGRGGSEVAVSAGKALAAAPAVVTAPTLSGTPRPGRALTCNRGTWTDASRFAYAWQRNGITIAGVTSTRYTVLTGDVGATITCTVTPTGPGGSTAATTAGLLVTR